MTDPAITEGPAAQAESSAVRVALWRALHLMVDAPPAVFHDEVGLELAAPPEGWRDRPDMDPEGTKGFRAAIVARARFIDDLVAEQAAAGVGQYVILGVGLDSFAQRRPELASRLRVFEIDRAGPQAWKRQRLEELGYGVPEWLRMVPVDFETPGDWWAQLAATGFERTQPALVVSIGVSMYLTRAATEGTLRQLAEMAPGSTLAMTFLLPVELLDEADRPALQATMPQAQAAGTPFLSFYAPDEMVTMARRAGFGDAHHVAGASFAARYFAGRRDGLRPHPGEDILIART